MDKYLLSSSLKVLEYYEIILSFVNLYKYQHTMSGTFIPQTHLGRA
jgi:hypothetical protein